MGVHAELVGATDLRVGLRSGDGEGRRPDEVILVVVPVAIHGVYGVGRRESRGGGVRARCGGDEQTD